MKKVKKILLVTDIVNRRILKLWIAFVIKGMGNTFFAGAFYIDGGGLMSNSINVNGMTSYYNNFIKSVTTQTSVDKGSANSKKTVTGDRDSFVSMLSSKVESSGALDETSVVSKKDMSLEEYKNYISDQISSFPIHPSQANESYSINISDAGFEAMKNDPEYEAWVLNDLKTCFATPVPSWYRAMGGPPTYNICNYGATKEEYNGRTFAVGNTRSESIFNAHSKDSFWTKRSKQKTIQNQMDDKAAEKKQLEKKWLKESAEKRQAYTDFLNGKAFSISEFNDMFSISADSKVAGILSAYEAGTIIGGI